MNLKKALNLPLSTSLQTRGNNLSCVVSYKDSDGEHKTKWLATGLPVGTSERILNKRIKELVNEFYEELMRERYSPAAKATDKHTDNADVKGGSDITFSDAADEWLKNRIRKKKLAESTITGYKSKAKTMKEYFPDDLLLKDLTTDMILEFYDSRYDDGNNGTTVRKYHVQIKSILNYAVKKGYISKNVIPDDEDAPKKEEFIANFCTLEEITEVINLFKGDRMELPLILTAYYGFRRSEVCGLRWSAVDFENNTITVNHIMTNKFDGGEKCVGVDRCKSEKSRRTLPLVGDIKILLLQKKEREEKLKKLCGDSWDSEFEGYICRDDMGALITPEFISNHFRHIINKSGFKHIRFHDLRHSCASLLLKKGVQMKQIQVWLGHSSYAITADIYSHLDSSSNREVGDVLQSAFSRNF